jgi:hypothetical protein
MIFGNCCGRRGGARSPARLRIAIAEPLFEPFITAFVACTFGYFHELPPHTPAALFLRDAVPDRIYHRFALNPRDEPTRIDERTLIRNQY